MSTVSRRGSKRARKNSARSLPRFQTPRSRPTPGFVSWTLSARLFRVASLSQEAARDRESRRPWLPPARLASPSTHRRAPGVARVIRARPFPNPRRAGRAARRPAAGSRAAPPRASRARAAPKRSGRGSRGCRAAESAPRRISGSGCARPLRRSRAPSARCSPCARRGRGRGRRPPPSPRTRPARGPRLMPYSVTIRRAQPVACWRSLEAPVEK